MLTAFLVLFLSASAAHGAATILHHDLSVVLHPESNTMSAADATLSGTLLAPQM